MTEQMLPDLMGSALGGISLGRLPHVSTDNKQFMAVIGREKRNVGGFDQQRGCMFFDFMVVGMSDHAIRAHFEMKPKDPNDPNPAQIAVYDPANPTPPICTSENGRGPSITSRRPQSPSCANCWAAQWGSAISQRGERIPACTSKKRLVVITPLEGWWETPLQFDIPPAAFQNWGALIQILKDGRIQRLESVVIRAYFIPMEDGFLKFEPAPNGYVEQMFGAGATPVLHQHMLSEQVAILAGKKDQPIDPATWTPASAQAAIPGQYGQQHQLAAPAPVSVPPQQGLAYAPETPAQTYAPQTQPQTQQLAPVQGYQGQPGAQYGAGPAAAPYAPTGQFQAPQQHAAPPAGPANSFNPAPQQHVFSPASGPSNPSPQQYASPPVTGGYGPSGGVPNGPSSGPGVTGYANPQGPAPTPGYQQPNYQQPAQLPPPPASFQTPTTPPDMHSGAPIDGEPASGKRKRRTKAEMEADRLAQQQGAPAHQGHANAGQQMASYGMASPADGDINSLRSQMQGAMTMQVPNP